MHADKPDSVIVDGEVVNLWVRRLGASYLVRGEFRGQSFTGKGSSASAAKADWKKQAEYEANK